MEQLPEFVRRRWSVEPVGAAEHVLWYGPVKYRVSPSDDEPLADPTGNLLGRASGVGVVTSKRLIVLSSMFTVQLQRAEIRRVDYSDVQRKGEAMIYLRDRSTPSVECFESRRQMRRLRDALRHGGLFEG